MKSILPIHRAISGLNFHGNEKLLVSALDELFHLGVDMGLKDAAGNSCMHKAIQVCNSKQVVVVVDNLIKVGCDVNGLNKDGESVLHMECRKLRQKSIQVVELLLRNGAVCNNRESYALDPLTLTLLRASEISSITTSTDCENASGVENDKLCIEGKRVWVPILHLLLKAGAKWDNMWTQNSKSRSTQLHLLLTSFPPPVDQIIQYKNLVESALDTGFCNSMLEDGKGRNCVFVFCEAMGKASFDTYPECQCILANLLSSSKSAGIGNADRSGRTVFDIKETLPESCLASCRPLLLNNTSEHFYRSTTSSTDRRLNDVALLSAKKGSLLSISKLKPTKGESVFITKSFMPRNLVSTPPRGRNSGQSE